MWVLGIAAGLIVLLCVFGAVRYLLCRKGAKAGRTKKISNDHAYEQAKEAIGGGDWDTRPQAQKNAEESPLLTQVGVAPPAGGVPTSPWRLPPTPTSQQISTMPQLATQPRMQAMATQYPGTGTQARSYVPAPGVQQLPSQGNQVMSANWR
jgi:hypothetical protein